MWRRRVVLALMVVLAVLAVLPVLPVLTMVLLVLLVLLVPVVADSHTQPPSPSIALLDGRQVLPRLRWVHTMSAGVDHINCAKLAARAPPLTLTHNQVPPLPQNTQTWLPSPVWCLPSPPPLPALFSILSCAIAVPHRTAQHKGACVRAGHAF